MGPCGREPISSPVRPLRQTGVLQEMGGMLALAHLAAPVTRVGGTRKEPGDCSRSDIECEIHNYGAFGLYAYWMCVLEGTKENMVQKGCI